MPGFMANSNTGPGLVVAKFETRSVPSVAASGSFTDHFERVANVAAKINFIETEKPIAVPDEPLALPFVAKYCG